MSAYRHVHIGAVLDQQSDDIGVAFRHRNVHGTLTRRGNRVRIALTIEQCLDERVVALEARVMQQREMTHERALEFASSAGRLDEIQRQIGVVLIYGRKESRAACLVLGVHVGARLDELDHQLHDSVFLHRRRHGQPDGFDEWCVAVVVRYVRIGAEIEQTLDNAQIVVADRDR